MLFPLGEESKGVFFCLRRLEKIEPAGGFQRNVHLLKSPTVKLGVEKKGKVMTFLGSLSLKDKLSFLRLTL